MKTTKRSKIAKATSSDDITIVIPKQKAAGGAAGAVVGGIVGGPVGAVVGGVVGAAMAGNTEKVKGAIRSGMEAARKSGIGKKVRDAASAAGHRIADAYRQVKSHATHETETPPAIRKSRKPTAKKKAPAKRSAKKR